MTGGGGKNERAHIRFTREGRLLRPDGSLGSASLDMSKVQLTEPGSAVETMLTTDPEHVHQWPIPPKPRDLPGWRVGLRRAWRPGGQYFRLAPLLYEMSGGVQDLDPAQQEAACEQAQLWYVSRSMCDLLLGAAPSLPDTPLRLDMVPDPSGLVVFERTLPGLDADGTEHVVSVGAMTWMPGWWRPGSNEERPCLGITVYGPLDRSPWVLPLGALVWPVGETCDALLAGTVAPTWPGLDDTNRDPTQVGRSMAEDRRRLMALWLLATSPGIAAPWEPRRQDRASQRFSARHGLPSEVRVITLREQPSRKYEVQLEGTPLDHRVPVTGHWKNQAVGPRWSEHRPTWIDPYIRGPEGTPLVVRPTVKAWTR